MWGGALHVDDTKRLAIHELGMTAYFLLHDVISLFPDLGLPSCHLMNFFPVSGRAYLLRSVLTVCQIETKQ